MTVDRASGGVALAAVFFALPTLGSTAAERFLAMSIAGARRSLYVTNAYFAPDDNFVALLADAAQRGIDVRILEWQPTTLHSETFVVDGQWASIGTMNFDNRSLALNDEVTLMVRDSAFGARMDSVFVDDLRYAKEVDTVTFARRPWTEHVGEWAASLIARLL
jgi:cardiolipin synthase